jgi:hypothetical protein
LVKLTHIDDKAQWIPIESITIYYTGYRELCPGSESCNYANTEQGKPKNCNEFLDCQFKSCVNHPDINRVINFQEHIICLDKSLKELIKNRLHNRSRIARMNYMGKKIITFLLDLYYSTPRVMHDRVWDKLRIYRKKEGVSPEIKEWVSLPQQQKDLMVFKKHLLDILKDQNSTAYENNRISLACQEELSSTLLE